jgi:hypothetical protein
MNDRSSTRVQAGVSRLAVLVVAGCASAPLKPSVSLETPVAACQPTEEPAAHERPRAERARRDDVRRELAAIEAALDALDDEIAAAAVTSGPTRDDALVAAIERSAIVRTATLDNLRPDAPAQLRRLARRYYDLLADKLVLERDLGQKHPDVVEAKHRIERVRDAFERQKTVEAEEARAWHDEVDKLPPRAPPPRVRQAKLRALRDTVDRFASDALAPSDAPAEIRLAVDRAAEVAREADELSPELGPKHPEMIRLAAAHDDAAAAIKVALAATDDALAREIAQLDAPRPPAAIDGGKLAKRVELAARARELRRELDALSP